MMGSNSSVCGFESRLGYLRYANVVLWSLPPRFERTRQTYLFHAARRPVLSIKLLTGKLETRYALRPNCASFIKVDEEPGFLSFNGPSGK